ncbi:MAG: hypothetical protein ABJA57_06495 [Ginsengibacter sp.]
MSYTLFFVYLVFFCWLLTRIKFITTTGLGNKLIIILFLCRIIAGAVNGYINLYFYQQTDTLFFHLQGIAEYHLLFHDPRAYLSDLFQNNYQEGYSRIFDSTNSFWNDLRSNLIIKMLSIFNIASGSNYFINQIFYNFLIFIASAAFFKIFSVFFPAKKNTLIICVFLLPSFLYFTSGLHKDGLIFLGLGIVSFNVMQVLVKGTSLKRYMYIFAGLLIIFLMRNFVFLLLVPALIAWLMSERNKKPMQTFIITYFLFASLFFLSGFLNSKLNLLHYVSERQIEFMDLSKNSASAIHVNPLFPNFRSFLNNLPQAINHTFMRPYITETSNLLYLPASIEILAYQILLFLFLFFGNKNLIHQPFLYFTIFFSVSMFVLIGFTIPILGAIVRYRSVFLPLLITPIACSVNWTFLEKKKHIIK